MAWKERNENVRNEDKYMTHIVYQKPRKSIIGKKKDKSQRVMTEPEGMGKKVLSGRGNLNCDP